MEPLARGANVVAALRANLDTSLSMSICTRTSGSSAGGSRRCCGSVAGCCWPEGPGAVCKGGRPAGTECGMWHWWQHDQHGLNFVSPQHQTCHQHPTAHPSAWLPLRRAPPPRPAGAGGATAPPHARGPPQMAGSGWSGGQPAAAERLPGAAGRPQPCCRPEQEPFLLRVEMGSSGAAATSAVFPQCCNQVQGAPDFPPPSTSSPCSA